jgi:membrane protein DedA with SNARE-associated domain
MEVALREEMTAIIHFILRHGYPILFAAVFARQIGLPVPAPGFLLAAGALAGSGKLNLVLALALSVAACVLADWFWYEAGRAWGDRVLHFIYSSVADPDTAERRSRRLFAQHGPPLLVFDKFVPGLDAVVPPLAGTSGTSRFRFVAFETVGACLWTAAYSVLGYVFSHDLNRAGLYAGKASTLLTALLALAALGIFLVRKLIQRRRRRGERAAGSASANPVPCVLDRQPSKILEGVNHER